MYDIGNPGRGLGQAQKSESTWNHLKVNFSEMTLNGHVQTLCFVMSIQGGHHHRRQFNNVSNVIIQTAHI
jgi:hypothetical protein